MRSSVRCTRRRRVGLAGTVVIALVSALALQTSIRAGGSRFFELSDFGALDGLDLRGVALTVDGSLVVGPRQQARVGPSVPVLWDVVPTSDGGAIAVGGSPGVVIAIPATGEGRQVASFDEAEVTAAVLHGERSLVVGVSPGGLLFAIDRDDGSRSELLRSGSRYVWDMLVDGSGRLWIATGGPGALLRLDEQAREPVRILELGPEQVRCLAAHPDGGIVLGTSGSGQVRRVDVAGRVAVLHDSDLEEVTALATGPDGTVYAALAASSPAVGLSKNQVPAPAPAAASGARSQPPPAKRETAVRPGAPGKGGPVRSRVISLAPDGRTRSLWESRSEIALSLLHRGDGTLWVGTSPGGTIHRIWPEGRSAQLARLPARSITALRATPAGRVWVATGGLGSLAVLEPHAQGTGIATGRVLEAGPGAAFGRMEWWARGGRTDRIELSVRSGNTEHPDASWSAWSDWRRGGRAPAGMAPPGRYLQWRARLHASGPDDRPELSRVRIAYLPQNRAPALSKTKVLPAGVVLEPLPLPPGQSGSSAGGQAAAAASDPRGGGKAPAAPRTRRVYRPGKRTVVWQAEDKDGDPLVSRLWLRADGDAKFLLFAEGIETSFHVFDESGLPDGGFVFRIEVTDQPANTPARASVIMAETPRFVVDRTPPAIEALRRMEGTGRARLQFAVHDAVGAPQQVEIRVDDGASFGALPVDGLADENREEYQVELPELPGGEHVAGVKVTDLGGNVSSARLRFQVQEKARR